jgi:hypothetical protein
MPRILSELDPDVELTLDEEEDISTREMSERGKDKPCEQL